MADINVTVIEKEIVNVTLPNVSPVMPSYFRTLLDTFDSYSGLDGQLLQVDEENGRIVAVDVSGLFPDYVIKTANYDIVNNDDKKTVYMDSTAESLISKLPPSPDDKQIHIIKNTGITENNVTIDRNENPIDKLAEDFVLRSSESVKLQYTTDGWFIT